MSNSQTTYCLETALLSSWSKPNLLSVLLLPLSLLYYILSSVHRLAYKSGLLRVYSPPVPTIVVGNLTVGGSGKSPFVGALALALKERGLKVGIVSRGYKRQSDSNDAVRVLDESSEVSEVGDEPMMLYLQTKVPVAVSANRRAAIESLLSRAKLDAIICDDGLQHWQLLPSLRICIEDRTVESSNSFLLPAGPYREPFSRKKNMDEVVYHVSPTHSDRGNYAPSFYLQSGAVMPVTQKASNLHTSTTEFNLVAGIAKPQRFFETAQSLGYAGPEHRFVDHHDFTQDDLIFDNGLPVLMTEKDAVKCRDFDLENLYYLPVTARLDEQMLDRITQSVKAQQSALHRI